MKVRNYLRIIISILIALNLITVNCFAKEIKTDMELPYGVSGGFKAFMDYRTITDETSKQYKLQQFSETSEGGFRVFNDYYLIAVGTFYSENIYDKFEIELSSGVVIKCIVGDIRQDIHSDATGMYVPDSECIIEFIVNADIICEDSNEMGDMSYSNMEGDIVRITKIE